MALMSQSDQRFVIIASFVRLGVLPVISFNTNPYSDATDVSIRSCITMDAGERDTVNV
jgi:hypothetical protein